MVGSTGLREVPEGARLTYDAAAVAPAPERSPVGHNFGWGAFALVVAAVFAEQAVAGAGPVAAFVGVGFGLVALVQLLLGAARVGRNAAVEEGRPHAMRYWEPAWYCYDCHGVFYPLGAEPPGISSWTVMSADQFRRKVWEAGGYARIRGKGRSPSNANATSSNVRSSP